MNVPLSPTTFWTNQRVASMIFATMLLLHMFLQTPFAWVNWWYNLDYIFQLIMIIIAFVPFLIPTVELVGKILEMKILRVIFVGAFVIISLLRLICTLSAAPITTSSIFFKALQTFLFESLLCVGAYWYAVLEGKLEFS